MATPLRWAESLRLYLLLIVTPIAFLWAALPNSGGPLMVLTHALLVLFAGVMLDAAAFGARREPALMLFRGRERLDESVVLGGRTLITGALVLALLALTVIQWKLGLFAAGVFLALLIAAGMTPRRRAGSAAWPELLWPLNMLIVPAIIIIAQHAPPEVAGQPGTLADLFDEQRALLASTALAAIMLSGYTLLCLDRDRAASRDPSRSSAVMFAVVLAAAIAVSCWGAFGSSRDVFAPMWGWPVPMLIAWGGVLTVFNLARNADGYATGAWFATGVLASWSMMLTVEV